LSDEDMDYFEDEGNFKPPLLRGDLWTFQVGAFQLKAKS
jgi:hypothetical protein